MADLNENGGNYSGHISKLALHLPLEIITDILSRLPIESILRMKSVCKTWYGLTTDPNFVKLQLNRAIDQCPRVILKPPQKQGVVSKLYLLDAEKCKAREIPEIPLKDVDTRRLHIMCSLNGLLCMAPQKDLHPVVIYNPIIKEYIVLPKTEVNLVVTDHLIGLGFDPSIKKYKAVRMYKYSNGHFMSQSQTSRCEMITLGESSWRQIVAPYRVLHHPYFQGTIFHNGEIHWIIDKEYHVSGREYILHFDIIRGVFRVTRFPPSMTRPKVRSFLFTCNLQLLIFSGSLALLDYDGELLHIWIFNQSKNLHPEYNSIRMELPQNAHLLSFVYMSESAENFLLSIDGFKLGECPVNLMYYFPQSNQYLELDVAGMAKSYITAKSFKPSLISIKLALLNH